MKILYYSDKYAYEVYGIKRSLYEELEKRGHTLFFQHHDQIKEALHEIEHSQCDQVWLCHTNAMIPDEIRDQIKVPVIGFGFSDPFRFDRNKLHKYDAYITNSMEVYLLYRTKFKIHYNPPSCDLKFHQPSTVQRDIDVSFIGLANHHTFKEKDLRKKTVERLKVDLPDCNIKAYGWGFKDGCINGDDFLQTIQRSKLGLDINEVHSPLTHRLFEYSACAIPMIAKSRVEVNMMFNDNEMILYRDYSDLLQKVKWAMKNPELAVIIGENARKRCVAEHTITKRVDYIFEFLKGAGLCT